MSTVALRPCFHTHILTLPHLTPPPSAALVVQLVKSDDQFHVIRSHGSHLQQLTDIVVNTEWTRLSGTVRQPVSYFKKADEDSNTWGKAEGVVDASAPYVLAWLLHSRTHERNLKHERDNWNLLKMELDVPGTRSKFMVYTMKMPGAISNRVFAQWWTWAKEQNGDLVAAFTPHEGEPPPPPPRLAPIAHH